MALFMFGLIRHQLGFGGTLTVAQTQEKLSEITHGCSRGGSSPRGIFRGFWLDWESWFEFDLTYEELKCLEDKGKISNCACSREGRQSPPDWFRSEGKTFTIVNDNGPSYPCIWHQPGGKYWLAEAEGTSCLLPQSFEKNGVTGLKWLSIKTEAPQIIRPGERFKVSFSYENQGVEKLALDVRSSDGCRARDWELSGCPFVFINTHCDGYHPAQQTIEASRSYDYSLDAMLAPNAHEGDYSCTFSALIRESSPKNWADLKKTPEIKVRVEAPPSR